MLFHQLFDSETFTYTYLLADEKTLEALIIDPVASQTTRDLELIKKLKLKLIYILETHIHADHITGASRLREQTKAKLVLGKCTKVACADILLDHNEELRCGSITLKALCTPGHTNGCTSYLAGDRVFTGDTLLIGGNGRTDFQEGSSEKLYESIINILYKLPPETKVYPAHDYKNQTVSSIRHEMETNKRIPKTQTKEKFVQIMNALQLAYPKQIDIAVPANLNCGKFE